MAFPRIRHLSVAAVQIEQPENGLEPTKCHKIMKLTQTHAPFHPTLSAQRCRPPHVPPRRTVVILEQVSVGRHFLAALVVGVRQDHD